MYLQVQLYRIMERCAIRCMRSNALELPTQLLADEVDFLEDVELLII